MPRLLPLDGRDGTLWCVVHDHKQAGTIPRLSHDGRLECATRTLARMLNLAVARGQQKGSQMMGPLDYYGNVENPHLWAYTIQISDTTCKVHRHPRQKSTSKAMYLPPPPTTTLRRAQWLSGVAPPRKSSDSLFQRRGTLWLTEDYVAPPSYDARYVDLSSFGASLRCNDAPFCVTSATRVPAKDDLRLVSYIFQPGYTASQTASGAGGGLFLETHAFPQFFTPLSAQCGGAVWLARWVGSDMQLTAVEIPHGYTLVLEPNAIHGDATLHGKFLMGMTSDHVSMQTADTVFLWSHVTHEPVQTPIARFQLDGIACDPHGSGRRPPHFDHCSTIFNPMSVGFWYSFLK